MSLSRQQRRAAERAALKQARKEQKAGRQTDMTPDRDDFGFDKDAIFQLAAERYQAERAAREAGAPSQARLEANRANAQLSTGPRSIEGKAKSRENSFKHGLYCKQLVLKSEDPAQLDALRSSLLAEHKPATETEVLLVNEMAEHYWLMKRYRRLETMFLNLDEPQLKEADLAQRMHSRSERSFYKALKTLREIQKERKLQERTVSTGFVPTKTVTAGNGRAVSTGFVPPDAEEPRLRIDPSPLSACDPVA